MYVIEIMNYADIFTISMRHSAMNGRRLLLLRVCLY